MPKPKDDTKVQDTGIIGLILIGIGIFPIIFFSFTNIFEEDYLLSTIATFIIYTAGFIFCVKHLKRNELKPEQPFVPIIRHKTKPPAL